MSKQNFLVFVLLFVVVVVLSGSNTVQSFTVVMHPQQQSMTKLALSSTSSSSSSTTDATSTLQQQQQQQPTFDTYQPGSTKQIVWKDTSITTNSNNNNNNSYQAQNQDVCTVSYVGKIIQTGTTFNKNDDFVFQINGGKSMPGLDVGCIGMTEGMTRIIRVPPNRAYGIQGTFDGRVPPNSDLEMTVTMKRLVSYEASPLLAQLALFGELRLLGLVGCVAVLALPPLFQ